LEIRNELVALVPVSQTTYSVVDFVQNTMTPNPSTGTETSVITKSASPGRDRAVDIGARKPGVDANFLHAHTEFLPHEVIQAKVA
jgi:hypothetical protein